MPDSQEPPSLAAVAIGTALVAGITGYYLGQARSIGLFGSSLQTSRPSNRNATASEVEHDDDSDISDVDAASDSDAQDLGELKNFPGSTEECKLILVVRSDLGMTKGMYMYASRSRQNFRALAAASRMQHCSQMQHAFARAYAHAPLVCDAIACA